MSKSKKSSSQKSKAPDSKNAPPPANPSFSEMTCSEKYSFIVDYISHELPPGPPLIKMNIVVNLQKCLMPLYLLSLMVYFDNFSLGTWMYFVLHGSYGVCWYAKDLVYPDASFQRKQTLVSALGSWAAILGPYMVPGYMMAARLANNEPSLERCVVALLSYLFGLALMMGADCQKYYVLQARAHEKTKRLINDGFFTATRNPNYLGEILIYGSFAIICGETAPYVIMGWAWIVVFYNRMVVKDLSLAKKPQWEEYSERSWLLLPKMYGRSDLSIIVYGVALVFFWYFYSLGGIERTIAIWREFFLRIEFYERLFAANQAAEKLHMLKNASAAASAAL